MTKQEREKIRQEIAKQYKERITELELENQKLIKILNEEHNLRIAAERKVDRLEAKYEKVPDSFKALVEMTSKLGVI
mgnify:CR=1 FL=1